MAKTKIIKTTTLEKRFEKLHHAANYAEECAKAIAFHADRLNSMEQSDIQIRAYDKMCDAIDEWCEKLARLGSDTQKVESQYYEHLQNGNTECELIEDVPNYSKNGYSTPDVYQVEAKFFEIGYYQLEGDPYEVEKRDFNVSGIIEDIKYLHEQMMFFVKALANADYKGIWESVGKDVTDIFETIPNTEITNLLGSYGTERLIGETVC